jgi:hypothetical protein
LKLHASCPYLTIDSAKGCSDFCSKEAAIASISLSEFQPRLIISVTFGLPSVMVPVLSKTMAFMLQADSSGSHHLISIQF